MGDAEPFDPSHSLSIALKLHRQGRFDTAELLYHQVLEHDPGDAKALHLLGMLHHQRGRGSQAIEWFRKSIESDPHQPHVLSNYGSLLAKFGRAAEALVPLTQAVKLAPEFAEGHNNLGAALERLSRFEEALAEFEHAVELKPAYAEAHAHRGNVLRWLGKIDQAIEAYRIAIRLRPNQGLTLNGLSLALAETADVAGCVQLQREVLRCWPPPHPSAATAHSNLLYTLHYDPELSSRELLDEHDRWSELHAKALYPDSPTDGMFLNDRNPRRRIKIGYVSADFRAHPVAVFLWGAFSHRDRSKFEVFCYSDVVLPDNVTARFKNAADHWKDTHGLSDQMLCQVIRQDQIDILVDQTGHAAGNRMLLFARRAAPVQVTFNGYVDTTGLETMDYRLTDEWHDPPDRSEPFYSECLVRLPGGHWCYTPDVDDRRLPDVGPPPHLKNGFVTFGCLNKLVKINTCVLALWSRLLGRLPGSKLVVAVQGGVEHNGGVRRRFEDAGIPGNQLILLAKAATRNEYLERYGQIDIGLDTFPFNGMTTTCDALFMGVPVVTLEGNTYVSRSSTSFLNMVGLPELIARSEEEYLRLAATLSRDVDHLHSMRLILRERMRASELCDQRLHASKVDTAYRAMWDAWCNVKQKS